MRLRRLCVLLLLLAVAAPVAADEPPVPVEPPDPDPRAEPVDPVDRGRFARAGVSELMRSTGLSRDVGFTFEGYVLRDGAPYGKVTLSARPEPERMRWAVRDAIHPVDPSGDRVLATALVGSDLTVQEMQYTRRNARGFLRADVKWRAGGGYRIEHETDDYENRLDVEDSKPIATLSAVILFLRAIPMKPGVWSMPDLDPNPGAGAPYLAPARIEVHRKAPWGVKGQAEPAWIASYTRGTQTLRIALAVEDRRLLGVEFVGLPFQFVPRGSGPVGLAAAMAPDLMTPVEKAVQATRRLRAAMPAPSADAGLDFRGEVRLGDARVGTVWLRAEPTSIGGRLGWSVLESQVLETGASRVEMETSGILSPNLTLERGTRIDKRPSGTWHVTYERAEGGMRVVSRAQDKTQTAVLAAADDASAGLVPVILFLRQVPDAPAHYLLSGWDPRFAGKPKAGSGAFAFQRADVHVEVHGVRPVAGQAEQRELVARCTLRSGLRYDIHLDADGRALRAVHGVMPKTSFVAPSTPGTTPDWYDAVDGEPKSARQVFIKFGRGYHRPREDLLAEAFHWPSLHAQAIAQGRYPKDTPIERVRKDWIDTFVGMSKHRTKGDCDDLLFQILMTSREATNEDGSVTLHTLPVYGGHAYRMEERDGRWFIVAID